MRPYSRCILFLLLLPFTAFAGQNKDSASVKAKADSTRPKPPSIPVLKPTIGMGAGVFTFYGDVNNSSLVSPSTSRIAYQLSIGKDLNRFLNLEFYVLWGEMGANERSTSRNLNFETTVHMGGLRIAYNFDHFLPKKRNVEPWISAGVEGFEYLSKTDLYDANGNKYYYWSDGSIHNLDQNDVNAANSIILIRDYSYESDIREMNLDGFGKYPERSWAVPVGAGITFLLNEKWRLKIGATMHFTFTDYIDGVTGNSTGTRKGDPKNDNFLMTAFSLHYDLMGVKRPGELPDTVDYSGVDFVAIDALDSDGDGVVDVSDNCPGTPYGVIVDGHGCPLDDDNDGVPNFLDKEPNSPSGALVDKDGVALNDSTIALGYRMYVDSTGEFIKRVVLPTAITGEGGTHTAAALKEYTVLIGQYKSGVPLDEMGKLLSVSDVASTQMPDSSTYYTAGNFNYLRDANARRDELINAGFPKAKVVQKKNGKFIEPEPEPTGVNVTLNNGGNNTGNTSGNTGNKTGNTSGNTGNTSGNTGNTSGNTGNNSGNTGNTGNKTGNTGNTGNTTGNTGNNTGNTSGNTGNNTGNTGTGELIYRVQVGAYSKKVSNNVFSGVPDLIEIKGTDGLYRYFSGSFKDINAASARRAEVTSKGYSGAWVVAYKNKDRVSISSGGNNQQEVKHDSIAEKKTVNTLNKDLIVFKVQLGIFRSDPPKDKMDKMSKVPGVEGTKLPSGLTAYQAGKFKDIKDARALQQRCINEFGIPDAFVIAYFKDQMISVQEALELLKQN